MNFAFSEEQEELRKHRPPVPRVEVVRGRGPRADGDRGGLRPRGLDRRWASSSACRVADHPRGVRRLGLQLHRARRRARGDGPGAAVPPRTSPPSCSPPTRCCSSGDDAAKKEHLPGIAVGRDDRHARLHRAQRQVGRERHQRHRHQGRRRLEAQRHEDVRARRPHRRPDHRRRQDRRRRVACSPSPATPSGLTRTSLSTMDQTRKQAKLEFAGTPGHAARHRGRGLGRARAGCSTSPSVALAAEQVGGAQFVLEMAVQYAKDRVQFGRPDRLVPGHQAQVRRHAARGRVGQVGRLLRRLVRRRS